MLLSGGGKLQSASGLEVTAPVEPAWVAAPFTLPYGESWLVVEGEPVMEYALITAGDSTTDLAPGASLSWNAGDLFHDAPSDADGVVWFRARDARPGVAVEGPNLPFPAGDYTATLVVLPTEELGSAECGAFTGETMGDGCEPRLSMYTPVRVGEKATLAFHHDGMAPLRFAFHFDRRTGGGDAKIGVARLEIHREK
jgi:hypothetical protein